MKRGLTVRDIQEYMGFEMPQAVYKWQLGDSISSTDNLMALAKLFGVSVEEVLVKRGG